MNAFEDPRQRGRSIHSAPRMVWSVDRSPALYQGLHSGMPSRLSGRLALSCLLGARSLTVGPVAVLHLLHPRDCGHQGKEGLGVVLADCDVLRYLHRYHGRHGVSVSVTSRYLHVGGGELVFPRLSFDGWSSVTCCCLGDWSFTAFFGCFLYSGILR